jgi:hypothetical protein
MRRAPVCGMNDHNVIGPRRPKGSLPR